MVMHAKLANMLIATSLKKYPERCRYAPYVYACGCAVHLGRRLPNASNCFTARCRHRLDMITKLFAWPLQKSADIAITTPTDLQDFLILHVLNPIPETEPPSERCVSRMPSMVALYLILNASRPISTTHMKISNRKNHS